MKKKAVACCRLNQYQMDNYLLLNLGWLSFTPIPSKGFYVPTTPFEHETDYGEFNRFEFDDKEFIDA